MTIRIHILATLLVISSAIYGATLSHMFMQMDNDEVVYYKLTERPTLTYTGTQLHVTTHDGGNYTYPIERIRNIQYDPPRNLSVYDGLMTGLILIYSVTGTYITSIRDIEEISNLNIPWGVYVLRTKDASQKIIVN